VDPGLSGATGVVKQRGIGRVCTRMAGRASQHALEVTLGLGRPADLVVDGRDPVAAPGVGRVPVDVAGVRGDRLLQLALRLQQAPPGVVNTESLREAGKPEGLKEPLRLFDVDGGFLQVSRFRNGRS